MYGIYGTTGTTVLRINNSRNGLERIDCSIGLQQDGLVYQESMNKYLEEQKGFE